MAQRAIPWFDPVGYQSMYHPAMYRSAFPGSEINPYAAYGILPRPIFPSSPIPISPEIARGMVPLASPGFGEHLSPENFISGFGKTAGNYLPPEFLEFLRAELLRCGKALQTLAPALEHENREVKEQARLAATAQFFYSLGLLYTRGLIIPPEVPGSSTVTEEPSAVTACEVFGEALERFAREEFLGRGTGRELGELSQKARTCFRALAPESEQLERVREERARVDRKKVVNA